MTMKIDGLETSVYKIPTEAPESDGTLTWTATTVVVVEPSAGGMKGLGFTYGTAACATLIQDLLREVVLGRDLMDVPGIWSGMVAAIRNQGRPGVSSMAIAAVDTALWDLKARLFDQPLCQLFGKVRDVVPIYGSGGFTSYSEEELAEQLGRWVHEDGMDKVKMKIGMNWGSEEEPDVQRVTEARKAIGSDAELFVDANGAYSRKQAVRVARALSAEGVTWFEEPVSSDDMQGLREIRDLVDIDIAAGEYGYDVYYFERMLAAGAVDVLQVDASRCAGFTEWFRAASVAAAHAVDVSAHTAQSLHVHPAAGTPNLRHIEYFHDHARVDRLLFDGVLDPTDGDLRPDLSRPGIGLELKRKDADAFRTR